MNPIDYGLSFIHGSVPSNRARFWVESRTRVVDEKEGKTEDFYQCGSCKGEETFAEKDLLRARDNSYDFLPVFGSVDSVIFRRFAAAPPGGDSSPWPRIGRAPVPTIILPGCCGTDRGVCHAHGTTGRAKAVDTGGPAELDDRVLHQRRHRKRKTERRAAPGPRDRQGAHHALRRFRAGTQP